MSLTNRRRAIHLLAPMVFALLLVLLPGALVWACPGCKDALASNDPDHARAARGYFWSIIFMFSMPYAVFVSIGGYFYWEVRRARKNKARQAEQQSQAPADGEKPIS